MPPARSSSATHRRPRQARPAPRPRRVVEGALRIRWDRVGRIGLLVVLAVVAGVYVQDALSYLSTRSQAEHQEAIVHRLSHANAQLVREQKSLSDPATIVQYARQLGMVKAGERSYVIMGMHRH
jgi:cell division protein FtsB